MRSIALVAALTMGLSAAATPGQQRDLRPEREPEPPRSTRRKASAMQPVVPEPWRVTRQQRRAAERAAEKRKARALKAVR